MDHIDAIAVAVDALGLGAKLGDGLERRAKASAIEHALNLAGYVIVPKGDYVLDKHARILEVA